MQRVPRTAALTALLWFLAAGFALAAPAFAQEPNPAGGLDLMSVITGLLGTVNAPVLIMLTVIAFAFHRIQAITPGTAVAAPIAVGALLGALSSVAHAQQTAGGWISVAQLIQGMIEGSVVNGGMAVVLGRFASVGLEKMWPSSGGN
jgi:hypothetical protein